MVKNCLELKVFSVRALERIIKQALIGIQSSDITIQANSYKLIFEIIYIIWNLLILNEDNNSEKFSIEDIPKDWNPDCLVKKIEQAANTELMDDTFVKQSKALVGSVRAGRFWPRKDGPFIEGRTVEEMAGCIDLTVDSRISSKRPSSIAVVDQVPRRIESIRKRARGLVHEHLPASPTAVQPLGLTQSLGNNPRLSLQQLRQPLKKVRSNEPSLTRNIPQQRRSTITTPTELQSQIAATPTMSSPVAVNVPTTTTPVPSSSAISVAPAVTIRTITTAVTSTNAPSNAIAATSVSLGKENPPKKKYPIVFNRVFKDLDNPTCDLNDMLEKLETSFKESCTEKEIQERISLFYTKFAFIKSEEALHRGIDMLKKMRFLKLNIKPPYRDPGRTNFLFGNALRDKAIAVSKKPLNEAAIESRKLGTTMFKFLDELVKLKIVDVSVYNNYMTTAKSMGNTPFILYFLASSLAHVDKLVSEGQEVSATDKALWNEIIDRVEMNFESIVENITVKLEITQILNHLKEVCVS